MIHFSVFDGIGSYSRCNQSSFEILQLFDLWNYQSLVMLFFSSVITLVQDESDGVCLI